MAIAASGDTEIRIQPHSILKMKLSVPINERASNNPFEQMNWITGDLERSLGLNEILKAIQEAKVNDNVDGIYLDITYIQGGVGTVTEIRDALLDFKESGKWIYCYSEFYLQKTYYLASVADKIYMHPQGQVDLRGLYAEVMFLTNMLEKIGLEPQVIRHGKFKSAIEPLVREDMSEANKEQTMAYVQTVWDNILYDISNSRNLSIDRLNEIANQVLSRSAKDAIELGLIDELAYKDEVLMELSTITLNDHHKKIDLVAISDLVAVAKERYSKDKIAVIYAQGTIGGGEGDETQIGSAGLSKAIRKAREDDKVKAIVLRVNSGGGGSLASNVIWREVALAKETKPLVVSMGDYAASGGYYISCPADTILANRNTLTGSIGVFGVYMNAEELLTDKMGLQFDGVGTNDHAGFPSGNRALTEFELEIIQGSVEEVYDDFIHVVSEGRGIAVDQVDSLGQGRVWTGTDAVEKGLVDELGGLNRAVEVAASMAGLENYRVFELPEQKNPFQELLEDFGMQARMKMVQQELGPLYPYFEKVKELEKMEGIQMRMEQEVNFH